MTGKREKNQIFGKYGIVPPPPPPGSLHCQLLVEELKRTDEVAQENIE